MFCPRCNHEDTKVLETRLGKGNHSIRRRRECLACDHRFSTIEEIVREGEALWSNAFGDDGEGEARGAAVVDRETPASGAGIEAGGTRIVPLPGYTGRVDRIPIRSFEMGFDEDRGLEIGTSWDLAAVLGQPPTEGVDAEHLGLVENQHRVLRIAPQGAGQFHQHAHDAVDVFLVGHADLEHRARPAVRHVGDRVDLSVGDEVDAALEVAQHLGDNVVRTIAMGASVQMKSSHWESDAPVWINS